MTPPSEQQIELLSLRSIAAYTARGARRLGISLSGAAPIDTLERCLSILDSVATSPRIPEALASEVLVASASLVRAVRGDPYAPHHFAALGIFSAGMVAYCTVCAVHDPKQVERLRKKAVYSATQVVRAAYVLDEPAAKAAIRDALDDFERLRQWSNPGLIGEPVPALFWEGN